MEFTTIRLAHKKSEVEIEALKHYDIESDISTILNNNDVFKVFKGSKFFDVISLVDPWNIAISEKFKNLLEGNSIVGWKGHPIKIEGSNLNYYVLEIVGKAGIIREYDEDGDRIYGTTQVDVPSWDRSDIFHIGTTGIRVCTLHVKEVIEKAKITNIEFEDLSKY